MDPSTEPMLMKTFEEQSDSGEYFTGDVLSATLTDINGAPFPHHNKPLPPSIFQRGMQSASEHPPLLPPNNISRLPSLDMGINSNSLGVDVALRSKGFEHTKSSSPNEGPDFGVGAMLGYLNPPQLGNAKFKRGPGRPRKDCLFLTKSPRLPNAQKIKAGGIRGRKKSDLPNSIVNFNTIQLQLDSSIGESPPRITDDTVESDSSSVASSLEKLQDDFSLFPEQWPGKVCGFCNLGERSMLGQGELLRLEIPQGFDPVNMSKALTPKSRLERDNSLDRSQKPGLFTRRQKGSAKLKRLMPQNSLDSINEPVDEICGHPEEAEYTSVFDPGGGYYYSHHNCAVWCDRVEKRADSTFSNLEVELLRALSQRCHHCGNLGAGLTCMADGCNVLLHFPCAAISGAFQDANNFKTVCSSHVDALYASGSISGVCTVCDSREDISSLIMCSSCGGHYHGQCIMALNSDPVIRAGWQCPACKVCQACRQPGDETKLLPCDTCDKAYHIFCLRPALSSIPKHSWKCKMCRQCTDCGSRTPGSGPSSRWHANFSVCDSCYQQRNKGLACPLCGRAYRHVAQKLMLQCNLCKKYVHKDCDVEADLTVYQQRRELQIDYEYMCPPCKNTGSSKSSKGLPALRRSDDLEDGINHSMAGSSQDSLLSIEDDSFTGTENSSDLIWPDKILSGLPLEDSKLPLPLPHLPPIVAKDKQIISFEKLHKRKLLGRLKMTDKIPTGAPFGIGRRTKFNELAKKRGPKPKMRLFGGSRGSLSRPTDKEEEPEPGVENRMVLCSARDDFVLQQDVCVMCGALGSDLEGRLISCSQCGQCYHPYCVNVKVTKVILLKGWRCLDCTVCEGCGQRNDESRLILCDECDVSFHTYCIDPPLEQVPHGSWKCKWCSVCHYCGTNSSRLWFENYTKCNLCASQSQCPVCSVNYNENDLIVKCLKCERWLHGTCDMIKDIKDAEKCADGFYSCILCRPSDTLPLHLRPPPKVTPVKKELTTGISEGMVKPNNHILVDGIYLSESGVTQVKSMTMDFPRKKRKKLSNISDLEAGILATIESVVSGGDDYRIDAGKDSRKRPRNIQKLGIGGFVVRLRGPRYKEEDDFIDGGLGMAEGDKPKRKPQKRKIRSALMENFPAYLQEAFFGKPLMNQPKDIDLPSLADFETDSGDVKAECTVQLSQEEQLKLESTKSKRLSGVSGNQKLDKPGVLLKTENSAIPPLDGISDILTMPTNLLDHDLVSTIMSERHTIKTEPDNSSELQNNALDSGGQLHGDTNGQKDELSDFLSVQFNLESMDSAGLPSMDSKDVEDIFKDVLVEEPQDPLYQVSTTTTSIQSQQVLRPRPPVPTTPGAPIAPSPVGHSPVQGSPNIVRPAGIQQNLASPVSFPPPSPYHSEYSNSPQFSPAFSEPPSPWPTPTEDADQTGGSYNQRSILKWEADELLGPNATISAVLYANINHPELKRDYNNWAERCKQIAKIWRGLPTEKRAPYLQKARENRAASRMQKTQQDQDKASVNHKTTRVETQEERQWKQMQALRQQQAQQEGQSKDGINSMTHPQLPFSPISPSPGPRPPRPSLPELGNSVGSIIRHPSGATVPMDQKISPLQGSPVPVQSQIQIPTSHSVRLEMAPPTQVTNPMFGARGPIAAGTMLRSPVSNRLPFMTSNPSVICTDSYSSGQTSEEQLTTCFTDVPDNSQYGNTQKRTPEPDFGAGSRAVTPASPHGQETRQHLRDLLQRQQVKKLSEQDPSTPTTMDTSQNTARLWTQGDWQNPGGSLEGSQVRHPITGVVSTSAVHMGQFRQPYLPASHPRMSTGLPQTTQPLLRGEFRTNIAQGLVPGGRMMAPQRGVLGPGVRPPLNFQPQPTGQFSANRPPIDQYGNLMMQQHQRMQGLSSPSMLAQQLGRPMPPSVGTGQMQMQSQVPSTSLAQQMGAGGLHDQSSLSSQLSSEHQELPESVTAELEKLEQEQHSEHSHDPEASELADLGMDDDELLGMGADFNILEYADPELDQAVGAEKTNIYNLYLEDEEKDENKEKRKVDSNRVGKSEHTEYANSGKSDNSQKHSESMGAANTSELHSPRNTSYSHGHGPTAVENVPSVRPPQPPPPYPGPPPPYPGRPQIGIANGYGLNSAVQPVMVSNVGMKNSVSGFLNGGRPPFPPVPHSTVLSHSNHHLSLQQRKTLLLQEQPLLLEDLLEQEKREQLRQSSGLMGTGPEEPLLSDFDFERLKADVLSSSNLPVSLSPPNVAGLHRNNQPPQDWQVDNQITLRAPDPPQLDSHMHPSQIHGSGPSANISNISRLPPHLPAPPAPPEHLVTDQERQMQIQYEQWLFAQQQVLAIHLKYFETEVNKLRKIKKSLNSKLRQLRKNNNELNENDAAELERVGKELPGLQKQLDQARKHSRQHATLQQDYRNKQQKRQQLVGMSPNSQSGPPAQPSPLGASSSPLHSTPQSPLMSPSPMQPSPLMQHSPMASPLTPGPSPGPAVGSMIQTSPRGAGHPGLHMMDDCQFSPNSDGSGRVISGQVQTTNPGTVRLHQMPHMRLGSPGPQGHPGPMAQGNNANPNPNATMMMNRGMNPNMMQQHRPMLDSQMQRLRSTTPQDHMRNPGSVTSRFSRMGMPQDMLMRNRPPSNFNTQIQQSNQPMIMNTSNHYNVSRVPFPSQSPTGSISLRSPSPLTSLGNLGSPPYQMMMSQNRVSPASSPMRRPSGSGSIGSASPMAERPQSVENPLTPRNAGSSRPHTPSGSMNCAPMEHSHGHPHINMVDNQHYNTLDNCNMGSPASHKMHTFMHDNSSGYAAPLSNEYTNANPGNNGGGGGGSGNAQVIPFPTFSFYGGGGVKLGLRGGNPFSVITEQTPTTSTTPVDPVRTVSSDSQISQVTTNTTGVHFDGENNNVEDVRTTEEAAPPPLLTAIPGSNSANQSLTMLDLKSASTTKPESSAREMNDVSKDSDRNDTGVHHENHVTSPHESSDVVDKASTTIVAPNCSTGPYPNHLSDVAKENSQDGHKSLHVPTNSGSEEKTFANCIDSENLLTSTQKAEVNNKHSLEDEAISQPSCKTTTEPISGIATNAEEPQPTSDSVNKAALLNLHDANEMTYSEGHIQPPGEQPSLLENPSTPSSFELSKYQQNLTQMMVQANAASNRVTSVGSSIQLGETQSQNALLKQLLQNTGCASTTQEVREPVGFSLSSLQAKGIIPVAHASQLSEAATRLPQPSPTNWPSKLQSTNPAIKTEEEDAQIPSLPIAPSSPVTVAPPKPTLPQPEPVQPTTPITLEKHLSNSSLVVGEVGTGPLEIQPVITDKPIKLESQDVPVISENSVTSIINDPPKAVEIKKAKRRQYQTKRKQPVVKEIPTVSKKRPRKAAKPEEDFDGFVENLMTQLRQLPPVGIVEPDLPHNYNISSIMGTGDYSKLHVKEYDLRFGDLFGKFGHCQTKLARDYYNTKPFGKTSFLPIENSPPSHRGFYNQEFAAPRTSLFGNNPFSESRTPSPLRDTDTPDTVVSSSSPELFLARDSPEPFPSLRLVESEEEVRQHLRDSPVIQIACPIPIRPLLAAKVAKRQQDMDKENNIMKHISKSRSYGCVRENGNITVTLTLSAAAVDEVRIVLRNLANVLSIDTPVYHIEKILAPPDRKILTFKGKDSPDSVDLQSILNGVAKFCKHCDVLIGTNGIRKSCSDLMGSNIDYMEDLSFCSAQCFLSFSVNHGVPVRENLSGTVKHGDLKGDTKNRIQLQDALKSPLKNVIKKESFLNDQGNSPKHSVAGGLSQNGDEKTSWRNIRYKEYTPVTLSPNKYKKPTEKELTEMLYRLGVTAMPSKIPEDSRRCALCHHLGDGVSDGTGRLLNYDVDKWVHLNCALWSQDVYETENGALVNVEAAMKQSVPMSCVICKQTGASIQCFKNRCANVYHVTCAVKDGCAFYKNKSVFCNTHMPKGEKENILSSLSVFRRVYIQRDENKQVAVVMHHGDQQHLLRVGSLIFLNVGQLLPHQLQAFHTRHYIYPVGYKIVRFYWSMTKANKRCQYICSIHEADGKPEFRIAVEEGNGKEHVVQSSTAQGAWMQVLEGVVKMRQAQDCIKVFPKYITGEDLFGLTEPAIVKVLESLPGIDSLTDYNFKYGRNPLLELPLAINPSGCARSEPKLRTHFKRSHTQRTGAFRASLPSSVLASSEASCPYSKQFVHSKSSQYKKMKQEWRNNVYLARSKIQGLGLYAARDIERHTMVIEYIGEIIRNELAELREKKYDAQNRGIYMFRIDDDRVIDATLCGGLARYINHSCNPNCVAETVEVERDVRIIIFANRRISRGEELAYDYKFEVEDDKHKIPCLCGTPNCQKWMN